MSTLKLVRDNFDSKDYTCPVAIPWAYTELHIL
jgi:hypothetical protein